MPGTAPPPGTPVWTLTAANLSGGSDRTKLAGCHIKINAAGDAYQFTDTNPNTVKDTVGPPLPTSGTLTFNFNHGGVDGWTLTAPLPLTPGVNFSGSWSTPGSEVKPTPAPTGPQSGTYTATADGTFVEEAASSAKA